MEHVLRDLTRTLTAFGVASVVGGGTLALRTGSPGRRAFGQQTAAWGAVNLAIAGVSQMRPPPEAQRLRRVLLVNAGLDLGYVATGAWLALRRTPLKKLTPEQARGHGAAVVLQGAGLFALDTVFARRIGRR